MLWCVLQVDTDFLEVIAFRHAHNVAFEKSDLFIIFMLKPISHKIIIDNLEIKAAKVIIITKNLAVRSLTTNTKKKQDN